MNALLVSIMVLNLFVDKHNKEETYVGVTGEALSCIDVADEIRRLLVFQMRYSHVLVWQKRH